MLGVQASTAGLQCRAGDQIPEARPVFKASTCPLSYFLIPVILCIMQVICGLGSQIACSFLAHFPVLAFAGTLNLSSSLAAHSSNISFAGSESSNL